MTLRKGTIDNSVRYASKPAERNYSKKHEVLQREDSLQSENVPKEKKSSKQKIASLPRKQKKKLSHTI